MISEFNTYLEEINSEMWKELCMKHGELRRFRKGDEFISSSETSNRKPQHPQRLFILLPIYSQMPLRPLSPSLCGILTSL